MPPIVRMALCARALSSSLAGGVSGTPARPTAHAAPAITTATAIEERDAGRYSHPDLAARRGVVVADPAADRPARAADKEPAGSRDQGVPGEAVDDVLQALGAGC